MAGGLAPPDADLSAGMRSPQVRTGLRLLVRTLGRYRADSVRAIAGALLWMAMVPRLRLRLLSYWQAARSKTWAIRHWKTSALSPSWWPAIPKPSQKSNPYYINPKGWPQGWPFFVSARRAS